ncbi:MAG: hypothetical protein JZU58_28615 [Curvibacter lanceolatus]|uniref:hypothetical protein n=1 Tax=Curvibacter lanceolatus TaxID=86182 RepID=UPI002356294A|nr:hypothetical protein [Curvibacter lanceolatus]MBV5296322.1 hypothetical protein [Curvibacter lanceolatus]
MTDEIQRGAGPHKTMAMRRLTVATALVLASMISACGGGSSDNSSNNSLGPADDPTASIITYTVTGSVTDKAMVTYKTSSGATIQSTVALPWSYFSSFNKGDFLYVSAQNQSSSGTVITEITGSVGTLAYAGSSGPYGIATASKSCCKK